MANSGSPSSDDDSDIPCPTPLSAVPAGAAFYRHENPFPYSLSSSGPSNPSPGYQASFDYPMSMSSVQRLMMGRGSSLPMQPPSWVDVLPTGPQAQGPTSGVSNWTPLTTSSPVQMTPLTAPTQQMFIPVYTTSQTQQWIPAQTHGSDATAVPIQSVQKAPPSIPAEAPQSEDWTLPRRTPTVAHARARVVTSQSGTPLTRPINSSSFPVTMEATNKKRRGRPRGSLNKPKFAGDIGAPKKGVSSSRDKFLVRGGEVENFSKEGVLPETNAEASETRRADTPGAERQTEGVRGVKGKAIGATEVGYETEKFVVEVEPGENITRKIASFSESNNQRSIFVLSASGSVNEAVISPVVLSKHQVIQGEHEIVSLSGTFVLPDYEAKDRAGFLTIMLRQLSEDSSTENVAIAGVVTGSLIAASNVKISVMCISGPADQPENQASGK